ncbi:B12-binding domain-containing radical SAM protein [Parasporobacterium paucivorans]|uniref:Radical SAM superfamily protein n=1 Tax=Parasporobacterium paucivorans DSM 15970 TaxID=1122934 RepID=A0A1M6E2P0_9FIRM|nr:radical SAM protein [Parasporobacterium paucivorans]SHI79804.1 Radical SAM superfamily protein [Parasporobacterium paucivorans DSM 15970]
MRYEGTVYRPPSEAASLIIQLTIGCARNTCRFCYMYKSKNFRIRPFEEILEDLEAARKRYPRGIRRIFLADGDALIVKTETLLKLLERIRELFPEVERVSAYGAPGDILDKSVQELARLREAGLTLIYMGIESGNDEVLARMEKGVTSREIIQAGLRLKEARMQSSVTLISGLGDRDLLAPHALDSARVISVIKPEYVSFLTLMADPQSPLFEDISSGRFELPGPEEVIREMRLFLENTDSEGTVFRANHASNYINLAGSLNRDTPRMLAELDEAARNGAFKPEEWRGL